MGTIRFSPSDNGSNDSETDMSNEFSLIHKIRHRADAINRNHPILKVPPGDDAALLSDLACPVITTDCQREGVHFRLDWQTPAEIGFKAVVVTLSDLAASYAHPVCLFINLTIPSHVTEHTILQLYDGIGEALTLYPCALGGGNISAGSELALDLFAIGEGHPDRFPLRSKAHPGEGLYVTGPLGLARAGLDALERGCPNASELVRAFKRPRPRFDAADLLMNHQVRCVMDISDGLSGDALHLAEASDIAIVFEIDPVHIPQSLSHYCERMGLSPREMILGGGEDYELLFTCTEALFDSIKPHLPGAFRVGTCLDYQGTRIINPPHIARSFVHPVGE